MNILCAIRYSSIYCLQIFVLINFVCFLLLFSVFIRFAFHKCFVAGRWLGECSHLYKSFMMMTNKIALKFYCFDGMMNALYQMNKFGNRFIYADDRVRVFSSTSS